MSELGRPMPKPTAQVASFLKVMGPELTVKFLLQRGGAQLYLPADPNGRSALGHLVGYDKAKALAGHPRVQTVQRVPFARKWLVLMLSWQGFPHAQIARMVRTSDTTVRHYAKGGPDVTEGRISAVVSPVARVSMQALPDKPPDHHVAARLSDAARHLTDAVSCVSAILGSLQKAGLDRPLNTLSNAPLIRDKVQAQHRRAHRPGRPAKIDGDPELQAFIRARIDTLTFARIASEVRATFPPDRHCSHPGLVAGGRNRKPDVPPEGMTRHLPAPKGFTRRL